MYPLMIQLLYANATPNIVPISHLSHLYSPDFLNRDTRVLTAMRGS